MIVRDPVKWYQSVNKKIRKTTTFLKDSTFDAPIRMIALLKGKPIGTALYATSAPTYLGAKYPKGLFRAIDAGRSLGWQRFLLTTFWCLK